MNNKVLSILLGIVVALIVLFVVVYSQDSEEVIKTDKSAVISHALKTIASANINSIKEIKL